MADLNWLLLLEGRDCNLNVQHRSERSGQLQVDESGTQRAGFEMPKHVSHAILPECMTGGDFVSWKFEQPDLISEVSVCPLTWSHPGS
jgi:hypothetical protein